jgi:hypothetical protein
MVESRSNWSWRLKLARAEGHLSEFTRRIGSQERRTYLVSEGFETEEGTREYVRRVVVPDPDDPMLEILAGELMFNARSALDHLACVLVPPDKRTTTVMRATQFPIFIRDIDNPGNAEDRKRWDRQTRGFSDTVSATIKNCQPYAASHAGLGPEHHSLAPLGTLQNADKHRQLLIVAVGLHDPIIRHIDQAGTIVYASEPGGLAADRALPNGGVIDRAPANDLAHVHVEVEGAPMVMVGEHGQGPFRPCPDVFEAMLRKRGRHLRHARTARRRVARRRPASRPCSIVRSHRLLCRQGPLGDEDGRSMRSGRIWTRLTRR